MHHLKETDPAIYKAIADELKREQNNLELIASENIVSEAVLEAQGCLMTNKYAEGYPAARWYGGGNFSAPNTSTSSRIPDRRRTWPCIWRLWNTTIPSWLWTWPAADT